VLRPICASFAVFLLLAAPAAFAARSNGNGIRVLTVGDLIGMGYLCYQSSDTSQICFKGDSVFVCTLDGITCVETALRIDWPKVSIPATGVTNKQAP